MKGEEAQGGARMLAVSLALNGIVLGSVLLLFSLGLTLIYGVGRIVNFAHGALFSIGTPIRRCCCASSSMCSPAISRRAIGNTRCSCC